MNRKVFLVVLAAIVLFAMPLSAAGKKETTSATTQTGGAKEFRTEDYLFESPAAYQKLTGKKVEAYAEAPILKDLVSAGNLPPVAERLPDEPVVIKPVDGIGKYGGTLTTHNIDEMYMRMRALMRENNRVTESLPFFVSLTGSADAKVWTLKTKKGLKWSDGAPFSADDIMFWYEDIANNKELTPSFPSDFSRGGVPAKITKIDECTVRITFAVSYSAVPTLLGGPLALQGSFYSPKHYLQKWHITYNKDAGKLAQEEGYDSWVKCFAAHNDAAQYGASDLSIGLPVLSPWVITRNTPTNTVAERNPYYAAVDTAGNQLPYIDTIVGLKLEDHEALLLKAYAGELDHMYIYARTADYPVLKENEAKGNYTISLTNQQPYGSESWWAFNLNHKDPDKRAVFQDVRFRQAMSVAIDRETINKTLYFGKGIPAQITVDPNTSFFKTEWSTTYAQYDPALSNRLLDEIGMSKRDEQGYRLSPRGKKFTVLLQPDQSNTSATPVEMVAKHWQAVGINAQARPVDGNYLDTIIASAEYDCRSWGTTLPEIIAYIWGFGHFPTAGIEQWRLWWTSKGAQGEEPPQDVKGWYANMEKWFTLVKGSTEYSQLGQSVMGFFAKQLYEIGTVGNAPSPAINKNRVKNVNMNGIMSNWFSLFQADLLCEQWWLDK